MTATPTLVIRQLTRRLRSGGSETLSFEPGVNVIVGPHNSGKTKWLTMLDYLLGDKDAPEAALADLASKFGSVSAEVELAGAPVTLTRSWSDPKLQSKIKIDERTVSLDEFYVFMMEQLGIPTVRYPQGDPLSARAWPELNWRSLFRHIYRQQKYWSDIADRQFPGEQHASLLQFLGLAEHLFSKTSGDLAATQRKIVELRTTKDQWLSVLGDVSRHLLETDADAVLTGDSIDRSSEEIKAQMARLQSERLTLLEATAAQASENLRGSRDSFDTLSASLVEQTSALQQAEARRRRLDERLTELNLYKRTIEEEQNRLERALAASTTLADLRITHCPACDQRVIPRPSDDECYVCGQSVDSAEPAADIATRRVSFEMERLGTEQDEADQLLQQVTTELETEQQLVNRLKKDVEQTRRRLQPLQAAAASIIPPDLELLDMSLGAMQQRLRQLDNLRETLAKRDELSAQIDAVQAEITALEAVVYREAGRIDFETSADTLTDAMNNYLRRLKVHNPQSWTSGRVSLRLDPRYFVFFVDGRKWSDKLGGTLSLYFLISYHYGLVSLTSKPNCHYPGLTILDLPAELEDPMSIADKENFVLQPFIELLNKPSESQRQVIVAGSAFAGLEGAHRNELSKAWK